MGRSSDKSDVELGESKRRSKGSRKSGGSSSKGTRSERSGSKKGGRSKGKREGKGAADAEVVAAPRAPKPVMHAVRVSFHRQTPSLKLVDKHRMLAELHHVTVSVPQGTKVHDLCVAAASKARADGVFPEYLGPHMPVSRTVAVRGHGCVLRHYPSFTGAHLPADHTVEKLVEAHSSTKAGGGGDPGTALPSFILGHANVVVPSSRDVAMDRARADLEASGTTRRRTYVAVACTVVSLTLMMVLIAVYGDL